MNKARGTRAPAGGLLDSIHYKKLQYSKNLKMRKEIIEKYGIDFQNENDDGVVDKVPGSNLKYITHLLYDWGPDDIDDPDHGLLTDIDAALADSNSEIQAGSEMVDLLIYQDRVEFEYRGGECIQCPPLI